MARRSLTGARILLTGASSGIGRALALELSTRRPRLLLTARRAELLDALSSECAERGAQVEVVAGDIVNGDVRETLLRRVGELWNGLDVLINNAGVSAQGEFIDGNQDVLRRIMEVNFFAAVELARLAAPVLMASAGASASVKPAIVNVGSILSHRGVPHNSEYCASKFALRGWSEALRTELAGAGVDVMMVSPGSTETEFFDHLLAKRGQLPWGASVGIAPEEVARQTVVALQRRSREIFPNWRGRLMVWANRLAPGLVDWRLRRYGRRDS